MHRAIVLAMLITPTHSSFIIKLHILIAPVEFVSLMCGFFFYGRRVEVEWVFYVPSIFARLVAASSGNMGEQLSCLTKCHKNKRQRLIDLQK